MGFNKQWSSFTLEKTTSLILAVHMTEFAMGELPFKAYIDRYRKRKSHDHLGFISTRVIIVDVT